MNSYDVPLLTIQEMKYVAKRSRKLQEEVFVPFIASHITTREQEVFNRRVIKKLGLLESQIHLVGMQDTISKQKDESLLFKKQIPKMVRSMIPVWKSTVYAKLSAYLDV